MSKKGKEAATDLLKQIFQGALHSARVFDRATGGCRLHEASEHFLTAGIFSALAKCKGVTHLEVPVSQCRKEAGAVQRGKPSKKDRLSGRYDLVHYRVDQKPRVAIEVKNSIKVLDRKRFEADFTRLTRTLTASSESTYQFCALVFFATADYRKKDPERMRRKLARSRLDRLMERIGGLASEFIKHPRRPLLRRIYTSKTYCSADMDEGVWTIGVVLFSDVKSAGSFPRNLLDKK